ncbi:transmembrane protein 14C-like isoform X1 [Micropterus salmoides]|uniref:transmembrane protein 14C-like isoform X1 n=2 Tax=Micropterus salmoides TaxID=27706 RepID=UPI0018EDF3A9|nr:transmembrane protein 14C-like isoform X1 [Micropterus salmoides]
MCLLFVCRFAVNMEKKKNEKSLTVFAAAAVCFWFVDMAVDWIGFSYAALLVTGGILGYVKAGSIISLASGLLFGLLAAVGAFLVSQNPKNVWLSLGTSGTLVVVMGLRFLNSWKFMPAGLMALASGLVLVNIIMAMLKRPHEA